MHFWAAFVCLTLGSDASTTAAAPEETCDPEASDLPICLLQLREASPPVSDGARQVGREVDSSLSSASGGTEPSLLGEDAITSAKAKGGKKKNGGKKKKKSGGKKKGKKKKKKGGKKKGGSGSKIPPPVFGEFPAARGGCSLEESATSKTSGWLNHGSPEDCAAACQEFTRLDLSVNYIFFTLSSDGKKCACSEDCVSDNLDMSDTELGKAYVIGQEAIKVGEYIWDYCHTNEAQKSKCENKVKSKQVPCYHECAAKYKGTMRFAYTLPKIREAPVVFESASPKLCAKTSPNPLKSIKGGPCEPEHKKWLRGTLSWFGNGVHALDDICVQTYKCNMGALSQPQAKPAGATPVTSAILARIATVTSSNGNVVAEDNGPADNYLISRSGITGYSHWNPYRVIDGDAPKPNEHCGMKTVFGSGLMVTTVDGTSPMYPTFHVKDPWVKITTPMKMLVESVTLLDLKLNTGVDTFGWKKGRTTEGKLIIKVGDDICAELSYVWKMSSYPIGPVKCDTPIPGDEVTIFAPGEEGTELALCEIELGAVLLECNAHWC